MTRRWAEPTYRLRQELGLPRGRSPLFEGQHSPALVLALFSRVLARKQPDFPSQTVVTGFAFYDAADTRPADPQLLHFLDAGEPPVVFTLGSSAVWIAEDFYQTAIAAVRMLGRRALLLAGDQAAALRAGGLPDTIAAFEYAPHSAVMPRGSAIVHQGGVGTTGQARAQAQAEPGSSLEEIFVTGSRISRQGFDAPTPVTSIDNDYLMDLGYVNVGAAIQQLPANKASLTPETNGFGSFNVGAQIANPDAPVFVWVGDGGFLMTGHECAAIMQEKLPVKLLVCDNSCWGSILTHQNKRFPNWDFGTRLESPDFAKLGEGYGMPVWKVRKTAEFAGALKEMLATDGPGLMHVLLDIRDVSPFTGAAR